MELEILDFGSDLIKDESLVNKIDAINEDEQEVETIVNEDLIEDELQNELDLSEEEIENLKKNKSKSKVEIEKNLDEDEESDIQKDKEDESSEEENPLKIFALELKERNLVELEDDWDGDEEALFEAYAKTADKRALETIKSSYQIEDPRVDGFLKYLKSGGDINNYITLEKEFSWVNVDIENEDNAKLLVTNYLKQLKKLDDEEASEIVEGYLEKGKLSSQALKIQNDLINLKAKQEEDLIKAQESFEKEQRALFIEQTNKIKSTIQTGKAGNTVIPRSKKIEIENFMFAPVDIKNSKGEIIGKATGLKKVLNDYFNDPEKLVELAYKLYEGFSDSSVKTEAESKAKTKLAEVLKAKAKKSGPIIDNRSLELIN